MEDGIHLHLKWCTLILALIWEESSAATCGIMVLCR